MIPYYLFLFILIICVFAEESAKTFKGKTRIFVFALFPYFALIAFKDSSVGTDTAGYFQSFAGMISRDFHGIFSYDDFGYERIEKGYKLFIWLLSRFTTNPQILLIATALVSTTSIYYFIKENADNKCLSLFFFVTLGFFQFAMTGIRQTLAISITLFGYKYLRDKKLVKFVLVVLFATFFHKSAIVFLLAYFVAGIKLNNKSVILSFVGLVIIYFLADKLFLVAADVLEYNYNIESTGNGYIFFTIVLLITVLCLLSRTALIKKRADNEILLKVNIISLAIWTLRLISRTAERLSLYYMPYSYVSLEQFITLKKRQGEREWMVVAMILCGFLFIRRVSIQEDLNHYRFFFQLF